MTTRILNIKNFSYVPFSTYVRQQIEAAFSSLIQSGALRIDWSGATPSTYELSFIRNYTWNEYNKDRCWYRPGILGVTGTVNIEALRRRNYCLDVSNCQTCEPVCRNVAHELGKSISITAVHEAAHLFGLTSGGQDGSAHTGDAGNFMFVNSLHRDYRPMFSDHLRTIIYTIRSGDTLSGIASRVGIRRPLGTWRTLYEFRGRDGRRNRDILRSGSPHLIYPGEQIWIPDIHSRLLYMRSVEIQNKQFTPQQISIMTNFLSVGTSIIQGLQPTPTP